MRRGILPTVLSGLVLLGFESWAGLSATSVALGDDKPAAAQPKASARVPWTTSKLVGSPEPPPPYRLRRAFPKLKFQGPVCIVQEPGADRLYVAENKGKIYGFSMGDADVETPDLFFDWKRQIYAFSFHPDFRENRQVFVFSPTPSDDAPKPHMSRVSRFRATADDPPRIVPESEEVIIEWPSGGHNGGEAIIGPDGCLYISTGDSTSGSDVANTGQGVDDLFSVIMRLDVDHPDPGRNYSIPKDNPFVDHPGARPEIWAFGFRNPWRMSFDPDTGLIWVGDVGQDLWEMIWLVRKGGNYGWSVQEGTHPFHPHKQAGPGPILPPVVEHHHTECRSITGGYVYQGDTFPELRGAYVYGDYQYGKIWGVRYDGAKVTWHQELADSAVFIAGFAFTRDGAIYAIDNSTGFIHRLERTPAEASAGAFPRRLSETGLYDSVAGRRVAPGVIPYSVNAPYWADGAHLERHVALPGETDLGDPKSWSYPDGMAAVQTLSLALKADEPGSRVPVETRVLLKQDDHWMGYTYLWNESRTDAELVGANGVDHVLDVEDPRSPGGVRRQTWRVPGRNECMFCHSRAAGFILGVNPRQMNRAQGEAGGVENQLRAFERMGLFSKPMEGEPEAGPRFVDPYDERADLGERARTYLHVNCSICHVSDGGGNSFIELDHDRTLEDMKAVGGRPVQGTFGIADAMVIAPGDPERSVLYYRMSSLGGARMPRVGSRVVDEQALAMLYRWIAEMPDPGKTVEARAEREQSAALLKALHDGSDGARAARAEAIGRLTGSTSRALALARAVGGDELPANVRAEVVAATKEHAAAEVRDLFERFVPEAERIRRLGDVVDPEEVLGLKGDAGRGRVLFAAESTVNCKSCHRLDGVGVELGPDLSKIGAKYEPRELLGHILEPSREVDPKFTLYHLVTAAGQVYSGLLVERDERGVVLRDAQNQEIRIAAVDVEELAPQKQSLMPELLLRGLTAQQAADLLAYLAGLR